MGNARHARRCNVCRHHLRPGTTRRHHIINRGYCQSKVLHKGRIFNTYYLMASSIVPTFPSSSSSPTLPPSSSSQAMENGMNLRYIHQQIPKDIYKVAYAPISISLFKRFVMLLHVSLISFEYVFTNQLTHLRRLKRYVRPS